MHEGRNLSRSCELDDAAMSEYYKGFEEYNRASG